MPHGRVGWFRASLELDIWVSNAKELAPVLVRYLQWLGQPSHVLVAMNVPDIDVNSHLRFSFGWNTKEGDGKYASEIVIKTVKEIL